MKTEAERIQYTRLKTRMISKCGDKYTWSKYYATLLGIGGTTPDQIIRNFFNDDTKRFNAEQLAIIYNDLEEHQNIEPFTQKEIQTEALKMVQKIGKLSEKMQKHFDNEDEIVASEIAPLLPIGRELFSLADLLLLRIEETKART